MCFGGFVAKVTDKKECRMKALKFYIWLFWIALLISLLFEKDVFISWWNGKLGFDETKFIAVLLQKSIFAISTSSIVASILGILYDYSTRSYDIYQNLKKCLLKSLPDVAFKEFEALIEQNSSNFLRDNMSIEYHIENIDFDEKRISLVRETTYDLRNLSDKKQDHTVALKSITLPYDKSGFDSLYIDDEQIKTEELHEEKDEDSVETTYTHSLLPHQEVKILTRQTLDSKFDSSHIYTVKGITRIKDVKITKDKNARFLLIPINHNGANEVAPKETHKYYRWDINNFFFRGQGFELNWYIKDKDYTKNEA